MKHLLALSLLLFAGLAQAQVTCPKVADNKAHVCWKAPTTNSDGSPIVLAITYTVQVQSGSTWTNAATGLTATDWTSGTLTPGIYTYRVLATAGGATSSPSNTGSKTATAPTPNPPEDAVVAQVTVEISAPAYRVIGQYPNARRGAFVALVPVGRACSGPILFYKRGYAFRRVEVKAGEGWQDDGPPPRYAAAPCSLRAS